MRPQLLELWCNADGKAAEQCTPENKRGGAGCRRRGAAALVGRLGHGWAVSLWPWLRAGW